MEELLAVASVVIFKFRKKRLVSFRPIPLPLKSKNIKSGEKNKIWNVIKQGV